MSVEAHLIFAREVMCDCNSHIRNCFPLKVRPFGDTSPIQVVSIKRYERVEGGARMKDGVGGVGGKVGRGDLVLCM